MERARTDGLDRRLALGQGLYFTAAGVWPILHLPSFEAVTGPKLEGWLVKTVGALIAVIVGSLVTAAARRSVTPEVIVLAAGSAAALGAVDAWYAGARRRIHPVYLADAVVEAGLVAGWAVALLRRRPRAE